MNPRSIGITKALTANPLITLVHNTYQDHSMGKITQKFYEITSPITGIIRECDSWTRATAMAREAERGQPLDVNDTIVAIGRGSR